MQTALITTTINVPKVLALYRKLGLDVRFFVAVDEKTPEDAINFCRYDIDNCQVLFIQDQQKWKSSELFGWNNDSRRNFALLAAVEWGADTIISLDDDMLPMGLDFFERFEIMLSEPYSGLQYGYPDLWCDVGRLTVPPAPQRGLPLGMSTGSEYSFVTDVAIGVMQGVILGVPDTDAGTTIAKQPFIHSASDILRNGFVVHPQAKAVFNSQITAFRRELAPCFAQFYKWQCRNTDIMASLIMRRVMREFELHTYFGPPMGFHNRSARDPRLDLAAEMWGTNNVVRFQECLEATILPDGTAAQQTRHLYEALAAAGHVPPKMLEAAIAFLDDIEPLL